MTKSVRPTPRKLAPIEAAECPFYLRFQVFDRPGVLASLTGALAEAKVSIEEMVQRGGGDSSGRPVQVVMMTHVARDGDVRRALANIDRAEYVAKPTRLLRVANVG